MGVLLKGEGLAYNKDMKKRKRRVKRSLVKLVSIVVICVSIYLLFEVGTEVVGMIELQKQAEAISEELELLQEENDSLTSTRDKLNDSDYIQTYARGNYMFSKDGEQIFYLPSDSSDSE